MPELLSEPATQPLPLAIQFCFDLGVFSPRVSGPFGFLAGPAGDATSPAGKATVESTQMT
jgi:hypothetical protein